MSQLPSKDVLLQIYRTMVLIRCHEETLHYLFLEGRLPGTLHLYAGEEALAAGVGAHLRREDYITSTHRPHGHAIAKGVPVRSIVAELFAKRTGCCKGKGGSMHVGDISVGALPAIAIVGGGIPISVGLAFSCKMRGTDNVAVCFFGDGASNEGTFHEALNMASLWSLPVIFVCENNLYGASTHVSKTMRIQDIAIRAQAYDMPGEIVDGNDALAVYTAAGSAIERARQGQGPTLLECKTYRKGGHSRGDPGNYRPKEEVERWLAKDPIDILGQRLIDEGLMTEGLRSEIGREVEEEMKAAIAYAETSPSPSPEEALQHVYYEGGDA